jgi:hypothetical protein
VEIAILSKAIIDSIYGCNPYKNLNVLSYRNSKINPKIHVEAQKNLNSQSNPEQKNNARNITVPDF